ncbi:MAG: hypothetical protein PSV16_07985 [Flavobacterium sp.]|nr:hypothetical protein [Flavobacterium sp.]
MKKLQFLVCFFSLAVLSCNDSDDENYSALEGQWSLVKITAELGASEISEGLITYDFNTQQHTVTIHNNTELLSPVSGIYTYDIDANPDSEMCEKTIEINSEGKYCFLLEGSNMSFDLSAVDGQKLDFSR